MRACMTYQQYQKFERNTRDVGNASFETVCRILDALELDIASFYFQFYADS